MAVTVEQLGLGSTQSTFVSNSTIMGVGAMAGGALGALAFSRIPGPVGVLIGSAVASTQLLSRAPLAAVSPNWSQHHHMRMIPPVMGWGIGAGAAMLMGADAEEAVKVAGTAAITSLLGRVIFGTHG